MKNHLAMLFAMLVAMLSLTGSSRALIGGGGPLLAPWAMRLIDHSAVWTELGLNVEQIDKSKALAAEYRAWMKKEREALKGMKREDLPAKLQEIRDYDELSERRIEDILTPEQFLRLAQLSLQHAGAVALIAPKVREKLDLTKAQQSQIQSILQSFFQQKSEILKELTDDPEEAKRRSRMLHAETLNKAVARLQDDQKKVWTKMVGKPFNVELKDEEG